MASNKQQHSNTNKTLDYSHNVTSNDATQGDLSLIGKCRAIIFDMFFVLDVFVYHRHGKTSE